MYSTIRIAIQKSGRLQDQSLALLNECGLNIDTGKSQLKAPARNFPAEILFLRDDDIPQYVEDGVADIGIIGENVFIEKQKGIEILERLGFAKCKLSIAIPRGVNYPGTEYLNGKKIATSYPFIVGNFLKEKGISAEIHEISGSVEIAPGIGLAEAICDIVSTGSTLLSNGLVEVEQVLRSEAVLVASKNLETWKTDLINKLIFRIKSVNKAKNHKYILMNAPKDRLDDIIKVLPGMKSPTIMPIAEEGWCSLHSVIKDDEFWDIIDQLKALGAQGILVVPIEKMII
jgi:ATP phosphoribosyltransferase